jgi:hypothetical protein
MISFGPAMNTEELNRKIHNLETLAADLQVMNGPQRSALRDEVQTLHDSLKLETAVKKWTIGGAAAGAVLPVLGLFSGGAAGAIYGAYRASRGETVEARSRLERLLVLLG